MGPLGLLLRLGSAAVLADDLLDAIAIRLASDADLMAGLEGGIAREGDVLAQLGSFRLATALDALPVVLLNYPDGTTEYINTSGDSVERGEVRIDVYATQVGDMPPREVAKILARQVLDLLVDAPLAFATGKLLYLRPNQPLIGLRDPHPGPGAAEVHRQTIFLEYLIARSP